MVAFAGGISGIAAGGLSPVTISDATTPSQQLHIDATGAAAVAPQAFSPSGKEVALRTDEGGRETTSHGEVFKRILVELRTNNFILHALSNMSDDLELLRGDEEANVDVIALEAGV